MAKPNYTIKLTQTNPYDLRKLNFKTEQHKKRLQAYRTTAQNILSDYISENIKGFGKAVDSRFKTAGFGKKGTTGKDAAPDMQLSVAAMNLLIQSTGTQIKQTALFQQQALTGTADTEDVAFAELKSSLAGSGLEASSASAVKTDKGYKDLENKLARKLIASRSPEISNLLWSPDFAQTRQGLIANVGDKLENLVVIQIGDATKRNRATTVKFFPMMDLIKDVGTTKANWDKVYVTRARIKKGKGIFFSAELSDSFKVRMEKAGADISLQIKNLTQKKFKTLFIDYARTRLETKGAGEQDINEVFGFILGFANEFERGGFTPFVHKAEVISGTPNSVEGLAKYPAKGKGTKPQKFISGAQLTALVQQRLRKIMPQGPRRGPPLSPTTMTNRTGRFRRSIQVLPRYRENVMRYMYDPIYMSLLDTPYDPDKLVSNTIREVVQGLFARQFAILRAQ